MLLPGLLWYVYDDYMIIWNNEPLESYVHAWYFRKKMIREFQGMGFHICADQRNPLQPVPFTWMEFREDKEIDPDAEEIEQGRKREESISAEGEEGIHQIRGAFQDAFRDSEF